MGDMVQKYLIPAMKSGSLKTLALTLKKSSSVETILRELPHTNVEELAIVMEKHFQYSVAVRLLKVHAHIIFAKLEHSCCLFVNCMSSGAHLFTQSHHSLVAAAKAGLSESKTLKKFRMESQFSDAFFTECILTSISRPLEELALTGFVFRECMHVCVCTYMCMYIVCAPLSHTWPWDS